LEKSDELLLKSFVESRLPQFYKDIGLACSMIEYLVGLSFKCLHKDADLASELYLDGETWKELDKAISGNYPDSLSQVFRLQMETAYLVLQKYYNEDGSAKQV
jgi:hypothetical protein